MGYKSEVRCLIYGSKQDLDAFLTAQVLIGGSTVLRDFKHQLTRYTTWVYLDEVYPIEPNAQKKELHILDLHEPSTKWYEDFPEVSAWMAFMEEAPEMGLQFEFMRLGEERGDTEERNSEKPLGFLYTSQPEIMDDINKEDEIPILFEGVTA